MILKNKSIGWINMLRTKFKDLFTALTTLKYDSITYVEHFGTFGLLSIFQQTLY